MNSHPAPIQKPWADMTAREKDAAALPLLRSGKSFGAVAKLIGAPSRNAIATVAARLIKADKLPAAPSQRGRMPSSNTPRGRSGTARKAPGTMEGREASASDVGVQPAARTNSPSSPTSSSRLAKTAGAAASPPASVPVTAGAAEPPPSAAPALTWTKMSPQEKREAVKARILDGHSMGAIAKALEAPNRGSIGSVADRLRALGELPRRDPAEAGREGRLVQRMSHIHPGNIRGKAEGRKEDPGLPATISTAAAWDPLEGLEPVALIDIPAFGRCRWPVEVDAPGHFMCGAPCDVSAKYCCAHKQLSISPYQPRDRKAA